MNMEVEPTTFTISEAIDSIRKSIDFLNESLYGGWGRPLEQTVDVAAGLLILVKQMIGAYDISYFTDEESKLVLHAVDVANKSLLQVTEGEEEGHQEYDSF